MTAIEVLDRPIYHQNYCFSDLHFCETFRAAVISVDVDQSNKINHLIS
jgi:hypothetical protein